MHADMRCGNGCGRWGVIADLLRGMCITFRSGELEDVFPPSPTAVRPVNPLRLMKSARGDNSYSVTRGNS